MVCHRKRHTKGEDKVFGPKQLEGWSCHYQDETDRCWMCVRRKGQGKEEFGLSHVN